MAYKCSVNISPIDIYLASDMINIDKSFVDEVLLTVAIVTPFILLFLPKFTSPLMATHLLIDRQVKF